MNAKELMIGDWVEYTTQAGKRETGRVTSIQDFGSRELIKVNGNSHNDINNEIAPIEITPELFVKNGWEKGINNYYLKYDNDIYPMPFVVEYVPVNKALFINETLIPRPITYVHELQHALRLCEIREEVKI